MKVSLIAAMAQNRVIGKENDLPWKLPDDSAYFKQKTSGHTIIMGRKSFEALGKPLPRRTNVVITRQTDFRAEGATVVPSLEAALEVAHPVDVQTEPVHRSGGTAEIFVIGGAEIYALALPLADRIYLTEVQKAYDGDARFPEFDKTIWREISRQHHPADDRHETAFDFVVYEK